MDRAAVIPRFYLYGEPHRVADGRFVHVENLDDRSRPSEWTIRPHAHADLNHVFHISEGGGAMQAEQAMLSFGAPCLLLVPAGVVHGFNWTSESKGTVITVSSTYLERLRESDPALGSLFQSARVISLDTAESQVYALGGKRMMAELGWAAPGYRAAAESGLLDILVHALRAVGTQSEIHRSTPGRQAALVARFRERVEARFRQREQIASYADALGTSQTRLRAACAVVAQQSPMEILDQRAVVEAQRALLYSNLSVTEIADSLGMPDAAYFSRFFTRHVGQSPRAYRAQYPSRA
jgi:AraC family transcriptional activator of pobA